MGKPNPGLTLTRHRQVHCWYIKVFGNRRFYMFFCAINHRLPNLPALLPVGGKTNEPHVVRYKQYKPYMVHLRERLAIFVRTQRGDTPQRRFARRIGVAQSTIMRIENQEQNVTLDTLEQLCKAFHVDVAGLFTEDPGRRPTHYAGHQVERATVTAPPAVHEPEVAELAKKGGEHETLGHTEKLTSRQTRRQAGLSDSPATKSSRKR